VIDFFGRSETEASTYVLPMERVRALVKPERDRNPRKPRRERWWQFGENSTGLRQAAAELPEVLAIARVSKTVMPVRVPTNQVFSDKLDVFATASYSDQAVLSSSMHQLWAITYGATMRADPAYTPSTVFETYPRPRPRPTLEEIGRILETGRRSIMLRRGLSLTSLYNAVNDYSISDSDDADIAKIRTIHQDLDRAVAGAYGWDDLPLKHGFYEYRQNIRYTVSIEVRTELLDRLLEENHRRGRMLD
jgi:hypothetical protein